MKTLNITETAQDLASQEAPFLPGYTFAFLNMTANAETVEECDTEGGVYTTVTAVAATAGATAVVTKRWIKLASAGFVTAVGN
jgi:hypothetical protein